MTQAFGLGCYVAAPSALMDSALMDSALMDSALMDSALMDSALMEMLDREMKVRPIAGAEGAILQATHRLSQSLR